MEPDNRSDQGELAVTRDEYVKPQVLPLGSLTEKTGSSAGIDSDAIGPAPEPS
jgi:hypothetical protein